MTFADRLRAERKRIGANQTELAKLLDVSFSVVSTWERGLAEPAAVTQEGVFSRLNRIGNTDTARLDALEPYAYDIASAIILEESPTGTVRDLADRLIAESTKPKKKSK